MSCFRQEIAQLIDEADRTLEETAQRPLVRRDFRDGLVYKTRNEDAAYSIPQGGSDYDKQWNDWCKTVIHNEFERWGADTIATVLNDTVDALELKLAALRAELEALRNEVAALRDDATNGVAWPERKRPRGEVIRKRRDG
jgi:hypothetical protein